MTKIQNYQPEGSGRTIDSVIELNIVISKYKHLSGSSCTNFSKELNHLRKGLINFQNIGDIDSLKWCLVNYLNYANHHPGRIRKISRKLCFDFQDIKFPVKLIDIHKLEKEILLASVFLVMKIEKNSQSTFLKILLKEMSKKLLFIEKEGQSPFVLIKNFNTFMYSETLHRDRTHFSHYRK